MPVLDDRKSDVLRALVEEHIQTGEPVSSRAILESSGLPVSSATIRNDLVALEKEGFAVQPHTSAGRIPTANAYRYYVDHLDPHRIRRASLSRIHEFFGSVHQELSQMLKQTSDLLAEVTHYPALVMGPGLAADLTRGIHLVPLGSQSALVVVVNEAGRVSQEIARFTDPVGAEEVDQAERVLTGIVEGKSLHDASTSIHEAMERLEPGVAGIVETALQAALASEQLTRDVYVGGASHMAALWEDLAKVHQVLELMEREAKLLGILTGAPGGTSIQFGEELEVPGGIDVALVSTDYDGGEGVSGRVGVLGPMRMDYRRAISVVEEVGDGLSERLGSES